MQVLSIIAALAGLVAVSSAAAIRPAKDGIDLCTKQNFKRCTHMTVQDRVCNDLGPKLKNKISSFKIEPGVICLFMDQDCSSLGPATRSFPAMGNIPDITAIQHRNSTDATENMEGRIQSFLCWPETLRPEVKSRALSIPFDTLEPASKAPSLESAFPAERLLNRNRTFTTRDASSCSNPPAHSSFGVLFYSEPLFHGNYTQMTSVHGACVPLPDPNMKIESIVVRPNPSCDFFHRSDCNQGGDDHVFTLTSTMRENNQGQIGSFKCNGPFKARDVLISGAFETAVAESNDMAEGC